MHHSIKHFLPSYLSSGNNFEPTPASSNCVEHVCSDTVVVGAASDPSDPHTPERTARTRRHGSSPHHPLHSALTRRSTVSPGEDRTGVSPISHIQNMVKDTVRTCNEHMLEEVKEMWRKANDKVCRLLTYRVVFSI